MRAILECYKKLTEFVHTNVKDDASQPLYQYIDLWNEQTEFPEVENTFDYPAHFIDFNIPESEQMGLFSIALGTEITFYHAEVSYLDTHRGVTEGIDAGLKYLENLSRLSEQLQAYSDEKTGSLQFVRMFKFKTVTNVAIYALVFKTILVDSSATDLKRQTETVTIDAELVIQKRPHLNPPTAGESGGYFDLNN